MSNQYNAKETEEKIRRSEKSKISGPYNPNEVEKRIISFWEKEKIYKFDLKKKGKVFSIDTPPPTVSGKMHIGHAFSYAHEDFIARFHRMKDNVFYPFGTDDNGLPTERLIERLKNVKSKDMPRSEFIKICLKTLKEIIPDFIEDWKKLGVSCDYDISYSTIDENYHNHSNHLLNFLRKDWFIEKSFLLYGVLNARLRLLRQN